MARLALVLALAVGLLPGAAAAVGEAAEVDRLQPWSGPTPALELRDVGGHVHRLADYRGRVVLLNFWATWCDPCREEMASIRALGERLAGAPFTVLGVNYGESAARVEGFVKQVPVGFPMLLDRNQEVSRGWRVRVLPATFLVGPDGRVRYHVIGEIDWATPEAVAAVRRLLPRERAAPVAKPGG
jgi:peroxiredoxin